MGSYFFHQWLQPLAAKITKTAILSFASLGIASSLWLAIEQKLPQVADAQTIKADLALDRCPNETYEALRERAIAAARTTATENLATNRQATNVTVTVVIRDRGQIAPILSLTANRHQGLSSNPRQGIKYFDQARSLLRFDDNLATSDRNPPTKPSTNVPSAQRQRTPYNSTPGNARSGTPGTFSQPGRVVTPTPGQTTNTTPAGQPGTINPTNTPSGQAQPGTPINQPTTPITSPGTTTTPITSPGTTTTPITSPGTATTPTTSPGTATTPITSPGTATTPITSPGTGLTPTPPTTPFGTTTPR